MNAFRSLSLLQFMPLRETRVINIDIGILISSFDIV
jgi:hypothetical protein